MAASRKSFSVLQWALLFSLGVHALLLAVRFVDPEGFNRVFENTALDVVLVNTQSDEKPVKAQAIAQHNLAGGGDAADARAMATTPLPNTGQESIGVDVIVTAPQKGWSGSPCAALVMLSEKAKGVMETTTSTSFACDLKKWSAIMDAYLKGGHAYHATMPTDALAKVCAVMQEMEAYGFEKLRTEQAELGAKARVLLESCGLPSVAAEGFKAPGVVVSYTTDPDIQTGKKFLAAGLQVAAGVPLQCDEPADFMTFRIGLFGLDKLHNVDRTVAHLGAALAEIGLHEAAPAR